MYNLLYNCYTDDDAISWRFGCTQEYTVLTQKDIPFTTYTEEPNYKIHVLFQGL